MRNWNSCEVDFKPQYLLLPDYLWGIETRERQVFKSTSLASRLPMRNWNPGSAYVIPDTESASRLPMRNWNTDCETKQQRGESFQTTYEELKQVPALLSEIRAGFKLPDYLWGIETLILSFSSAAIFASRLPMRNWNSPAFSLNSVRKGASRLPMRNWNATDSATITIDGASRLPMRNWNRKERNTEEGSWWGFQTTYEELKPWFDLKNDILLGFQTTYEELKLVW